MTPGFTAEEAGELLHVPASAIRRWRRAGKVVPAGRVPSPGRHGSVDLFTIAELRPEAERYHADPRTPLCRWCGGGPHVDTPARR